MNSVPEDAAELETRCSLVAAKANDAIGASTRVIAIRP